MARLDRSDIEHILARNLRLVLHGGDLTGANLSGLDLRRIAAALSKRVEIRFVPAPREHLAAGAI